MVSKLEMLASSCSAARHYLACTSVKTASKSVLMDLTLFMKRFSYFRLSPERSVTWACWRVNW